MNIKLTYDQAVAGESTFDLNGYNDWRLPNAKELQSIVRYFVPPTPPTRPPSTRRLTRR